MAFQVMNSSTIEEDEDMDVEALRLAALQTLKKSAPKSQPKPVLISNNTTKVVNQVGGGLGLHHRGRGRGRGRGNLHRNFQPFHPNNHTTHGFFPWKSNAPTTSNLITIVPTISNNDEPSGNSSNKQETVPSKVTSKVECTKSIFTSVPDKNDKEKVPAKFRRLGEDSDSDESSDDEVKQNSDSASDINSDEEQDSESKNQDDEKESDGDADVVNLQADDDDENDDSLERLMRELEEEVSDSPKPVKQKTDKTKLENFVKHKKDKKEKKKKDKVRKKEDKSTVLTRSETVLDLKANVIPKHEEELLIERESKRSSSPSPKPGQALKSKSRSPFCGSPAKGHSPNRIRSPFRPRSPSPGRTYSPRFRSSVSPRKARTPLKVLMRSRSRSPHRSRSPGRSRSPVRYRSRSPKRLPPRSCSRSPVRHYNLTSRRSRSRSPGKVYVRRSRSRSPPRQPRRSVSPPRHAPHLRRSRSRSPAGRYPPLRRSRSVSPRRPYSPGSFSPRGRRSPSPLKRRSPTLKRSVISPRRSPPRWTSAYSPRRESPRRSRTPPRMLAHTPSPVRRRTPTNYLRSPPRGYRSPSPRKRSPAALARPNCSHYYNKNASPVARRPSPSHRSVSPRPTTTRHLQRSPSPRKRRSPVTYARSYPSQSSVRPPSPVKRLSPLRQNPQNSGSPMRKRVPSPEKSRKSLSISLSPSPERTRVFEDRTHNKLKSSIDDAKKSRRDSPNGEALSKRERKEKHKLKRERGGKRTKHSSSQPLDPVLEARRRKFQSSAPVEVTDKKIRLRAPQENMASNDSEVEEGEIQQEINIEEEKERELKEALEADESMLDRELMDGVDILWSDEEEQIPEADSEMNPATPEEGDNSQDANSDSSDNVQFKRTINISSIVSLGNGKENVPDKGKRIIDEPSSTRSPENQTPQSESEEQDDDSAEEEFEENVPRKASALPKTNRELKEFILSQAQSAGATVKSLKPIDKLVTAINNSKKADEGDLRAELRRRRAERITKVSTRPESMPRRLLQSALQGAGVCIESGSNRRRQSPGFEDLDLQDNQRRRVLILERGNFVKQLIKKGQQEPAINITIPKVNATKETNKVPVHMRLGVSKPVDDRSGKVKLKRNVSLGRKKQGLVVRG